jgi:hypothetical protein
MNKSTWQASAIFLFISEAIFFLRTAQWAEIVLKGKTIVILVIIFSGFYA